MYLLNFLPPKGPILCWDPMISTWTPKVCKIMAFMAIIMGLGLTFYILLGFRETLNSTLKPRGGPSPHAECEVLGQRRRKRRVI